MRFQFERVVAINSQLRLLGYSPFATVIGGEEWVEVEAREVESGDGEGRRGWGNRWRGEKELGWKGEGWREG